MNAQAQKAYAKAQAAIADIGTSLKGPDYYAFLCELAAHLECLQDCYQEEHPEEFK